MNKHSIYLFLLSVISLNAQAIEADSATASERITSCFIDEPSESLCWQQMLSETNPAVRYDFGVHYANGDGVQQSFTKGRYWMHQAALAGLPLAQYNLGVMFFDGIGGRQSQDCAVHWLNKSAAGDDEIREMAQQALAALSELAQERETPKVFRVLTVEECEQLPEIVFPDGEGMLPLSIEPEPEPEPEPSTSPRALFREKVGQYLIELGNRLLEKTGAEQQRMPHKENDQPKLGPLEQIGGSEPDVVIARGEIEPDVTLAEMAISAPIEMRLSPEETEVTHALPMDETEALSSAKREEAALPASNPDLVAEPIAGIDPLAVNTAPIVVEKTVPKRLNLGGALRHAAKGHFTLQLSSASQAEPLEVFARKHKLSNYLVYETERHGRRWYVLVYGEYAGMTQAKQALQQLPRTLKINTPWIRSLAHVHSEL